MFLIDNKTYRLKCDIIITFWFIIQRKVLKICVENVKWKPEKKWLEVIENIIWKNVE